MYGISFISPPQPLFQSLFYLVNEDACAAVGFSYLIVFVASRRKKPSAERTVLRVRSIVSYTFAGALKSLLAIMRLYFPFGFQNYGGLIVVSLLITFLLLVVISISDPR